MKKKNGQLSICQIPCVDTNRNSWQPAKASLFSNSVKNITGSWWTDDHYTSYSRRSNYFDFCVSGWLPHSWNQNPSYVDQKYQIIKKTAFVLQSYLKRKATTLEGRTAHELFVEALNVSLYGTSIWKLVLSFPEGGTVRLSVIFTRACPPLTLKSLIKFNFHE